MHEKTEKFDSFDTELQSIRDLIEVCVCVCVLELGLGLGLGLGSGSGSGLGLGFKDRVMG